MSGVDGRPIDDPSTPRSIAGAVVIGRNEGARLDRCIGSLIEHARPVVYADSGSGDGSPARARLAGCQVLELDPSLPFSAARSRNEGLAQLRSLSPSAAWVQFVDGDCEIEAGWLEVARRELEAQPGVAVVFGGLRERDPDSTVYNRLCHMEWRTKPGEALSSGGVFMARVEAFLQVGGFNPVIVAGEESELCLRLRQAGWKIVCLPHPMAIHEAGITRFSQWWKRTFRAGHSYAQGMAIRGISGEKHHARQVFSAILWGLLAPAAALSALAAARWLPWAPWVAAAILLFHGALAFRVHRSRRRMGDGPADASLYAAFCVLGKLPMALGSLKYFLVRLRGAQPTMIEHKPKLAEGSAPVEGSR